MSWSFHFEATPPAFTDTGKEALDAACSPTPDGGRQVPEEQVDKGRDAMEAALAAATAIVTAGVVGDATRPIACTLSGHANKDHTPEPGWSNDTVSISLVQK